MWVILSQFILEDEYVLELIQSYTNKEVVSIIMGGSVRCLTCDGTDANKLLEFAEQN